jgi:hypothetical protein
MATKEILTIAQLIAECKNTRNKICNIIGDREFTPVQFYIKAKPYIGPRTTDEVAERIVSDLDKTSDLIVRFEALNKARIKANAETLVKVPEQISLNELFAGKEADFEDISIAEAINRKKYYKDFLLSIVSTMEHSMQNAARRKGQLEMEAKGNIDKELDQQFPRDVQKNWSSDAQKKAREDLEKKYEVVRLDPTDLIKNDSITKFKEIVIDYINKIDTVLSIVNAKTEVEVEY